jgi:hypothetical protein
MALHEVEYFAQIQTVVDQLKPISCPITKEQRPND